MPQAAKFYIDRFEGQSAVLVFESGDQVDFPAHLLPEGSREGDHLLMTVSKDHDARDAAADEIEGLQNRLDGNQD